MPRNIYLVLYAVVMVVVVVGVDLLFFRHQFWPRLIVNIGIVLVFAAFYMGFLRNPGTGGGDTPSHDAMQPLTPANPQCHDGSIQDDSLRRCVVGGAG